MNRLLIIAAVALVGTGCVNDSPLFVTGFFPIDPEGTGACELSPGDVSHYAGSLDLSGAADYQILATLRSELDSSLDTKSDSTILVTGQHRNTVILDTISFTYTSLATATVPSVTFEAESAPITAIVAPNAESNVRMGLLGPKALEALRNAIPAPAGGAANVPATETTIVRVKFEFQGQIISGGKIKSTPITFPISVFRSNRACSGTEFFCPTGACGSIGGQDGAPLVCSTMNACPAK